MKNNAKRLMPRRMSRVLNLKMQHLHGGIERDEKKSKEYKKLFQYNHKPYGGKMHE